MQRVQVRKRINRIFICTLVIFSLILIKLAYEQFINYPKTMNKAYDLWQRDFDVSGRRGRILDRNQNILACDVPTASIMVVPAQIKDKALTAKKLSEVIGMDEKKLLDTISKKVSTQKIQGEGRLLSDDISEKIAALKLEGVYLVEDSKRFYPNKAFLAQVLGFTGVDNQGLAGLELQYEHMLAANKGGLKISLDAKGHKVDLYPDVLKKGGMGMDVMLTIDSYIQQVIERELNNAMTKYQCESAWALAMDPNNGEILAMVSKPDFDPNHYQNYPSEVYNHNLPIWKSYEPGSTFKSIIFASALDNNLFDMFNDYYYDRGFEMVNGARIKSWKAGGHGRQNFLQVLENSSNPGFVEISRRMGLDMEYDYVDKFGFLNKTGVDLPGESKGIMFDKAKMSELEQATVAFGQGISVTSIQLVRGFSALINGGILYEPYITHSFWNPYTNEMLEANKPKIVRRIISKKTSDQMRYALESVVANGGGKPCYMQGYRIGGKTGTAQKVENGSYSSSNYILSFLSAAPMEKPKIVLYIALDSPKNDVLYGGTVVAPIAKSIYEDVLPYLKVEKVDKQMEKKLIWPESEYLKIDNFIGKKRQEVRQEGVNFVFIGEGDVVLDQLPKANTRLDYESGEVWIYLGKDEFK